MSIIVLDKKNALNKKFKSPLRNKSTEVVNFQSEELLKLLEELEEAFLSFEISVGLAAPQIGYNQRIIIVNINRDSVPNRIMINPKIITESGKKSKSYESCLSIPGYKGKVSRRHKVKIEYNCPNGEIKIMEAKSFMARVLLHEIDHLDGILFTDRMESIDKLEKVNFEWR